MNVLTLHALHAFLRRRRRENSCLKMPGQPLAGLRQCVPKLLVCMCRHRTGGALELPAIFVICLNVKMGHTAYSKGTGTSKLQLQPTKPPFSCRCRRLLTRGAPLTLTDEARSTDQGLKDGVRLNPRLDLQGLQAGGLQASPVSRVDTWALTSAKESS